MAEARRDSFGERWCFRCRKRVEFVAILMVPTELSYYGPHWKIKCTNCGALDGDIFPGFEREWEDF